MIGNWVKDLLTLTDQDWACFTFNRDPLVGRISRESQCDYWKKSERCAIDMVTKLKTQYGNVSINSLAKLMGIRILYQPEDSNLGETMFAYFKEPDTITVFMNNIASTDNLLKDECLYELVGPIKTADLLTAHEMYHYQELITPDIYTAQKHLKLWKLGPIENRSRIICLEEIGAMAFAKEITGLKCSPYLFNVIMLYSRNPQKAKQLYETYMSFKKN